MVEKIENPFENSAFDRKKYDEEKEMIARGINPYNPEENTGFFEDRIVSFLSIERAPVVGEKKERGYKINGRVDAERIYHNFDWNEKYLRSLVSEVTGNKDYADSLDYAGLRREGHKIKGIVLKILGIRRVNNHH